MPFFDMFKSRRARSSSLPRYPERYSHDSYNQASAYAPHSTSVSRAVHPQRYPPSGYGNSSYPYPSSGAGRHSQSSTGDQSWYQVEHRDYYRDAHDRDPEYYSYTEDSDRRSDMSGGRVPAHAVSDSSRTESPVPTVYRQETPALGSRLFEQFPGSPPAQVTCLDLHEEVEGEYDPWIATGYDRRQRGVPLAHPQNHHTAYASGPHRHNSQQQQQHHRRSSQRTFQEPIHVNLPSESSGTDVLQTMDNGDRIKIPRHPYERRPSRSGHAPASYGQPEGSNLNPERTYYIVPPGMSVIFRDEYGNELKRVGDFSDGYDPNMYDEAPVELTDEYGRTVYKTGENYTDDGSDVTEATYRPKVVHLGQFLSNGSAIPRASSPLTISLDRRGHHRHIHLEHSIDGSSGGSQGSDGSFSPRLSHAHSEGNISSRLQPVGSLRPGNHRSPPDNVRLRTIYHPN